MKREEKYEKHRKYIEAEGLDRLINFNENPEYKKGVVDSVSGRLKTPIPPDTDDLVRLHRIIRKRKCFTVLEFGVGYSSLIIADALKKNEEDWNNIVNKPEIRNRNMYQLYSVDTSLNWIEITKKRFPNELLSRTHFSQSYAEISLFNGQICHFYEEIPDIVPDFVYLDGPSPRDVKGEINGLSFNCMERTPVSADLLLMESTFLPGTFILIDGRTNNARFLERNFGRKYKMKWDKESDITTFELVEERLGKYNLLGTDFYE